MRKAFRRWNGWMIDDHPSASWTIAFFAIAPMYGGVAQLIWCPFSGDSCTWVTRAWGALPLVLGLAILGWAIGLWLRKRRAWKNMPP